MFTAALFKIEKKEIVYSVCLNNWKRAEKSSHSIISLDGRRNGDEEIKALKTQVSWKGTLEWHGLSETELVENKNREWGNIFPDELCPWWVSRGPHDRCGAAPWSSCLQSTPWMGWTVSSSLSMNFPVKISLNAPCVYCMSLWKLSSEWGTQWLTCTTSLDNNQ